MKAAKGPRWSDPDLVLNLHYEADSPRNIHDAQGRILQLTDLTGNGRHGRPPDLARAPILVAVRRYSRWPRVARLALVLVLALALVATIVLLVLSILRLRMWAP